MAIAAKIWQKPKSPQLWSCRLWRYILCFVVGYMVRLLQDMDAYTIPSTNSMLMTNMMVPVHHRDMSCTNETDNSFVNGRNDANTQKVILLTSQVSGSTWLSSLLDSNPMMEFQTELFIQYSTMKADQWDAVKWNQYSRQLSASFQPKSSSTKWVGFKLMYNQLPSQLLPQFAIWLNEQQVFVIHLKRASVMRVASHLQKRARVRRTGENLSHYTNASISVIANYTDPLLSFHAVKDWKQIRWMEQQVTDMSNYLQIHAPLARVMEVNYEDLDGPNSVHWLNSIHGFLGIPHRLNPAHQSVDTLSKYIKVGARLCEARTTRLGTYYEALNGTISQRTCLKLRSTELWLKHISTAGNSTGTDSMTTTMSTQLKQLFLPTDKKKCSFDIRNPCIN